MDGFLLKPPHAAAHRRLPLLVHIQGGPMPWLNDFYALNLQAYSQGPKQLLAQAGYAVFMPGRRGDRGYGLERQLALIGNVGEDVRQDSIAGVEALVEQGVADPDRLGVMGASYGGFASLWAIGHSDRFKAASSDDGVLNWISHRLKGAGNDDYHTPGLFDYLMGGLVHEQAGRLWNASPISSVGQMRTPLLVRYGAFDDQASDYAHLYESLESRGVPIEMLSYPGEGHAINSAAHARDYYRRVQEWFDYWLLDKPFADPALQKKFDAYKVEA